jgi:hypothetical protein
MTTHSSVTTREQTPHVNQTTRTATMINALKQRALAVLDDESIDAESRVILRYALETTDPWLARLVRQAEPNEKIVELADSFQTPEASKQDSHKTVEALAEIICASSEEASAALLVLMGTIQDSSDPKALANTAKHFTFTRCGESNVRGMVDSQIEVMQKELFCG